MRDGHHALAWPAFPKFAIQHHMAVVVLLLKLVVEPSWRAAAGAVLGHMLIAALSGCTCHCISCGSSALNCLLPNVSSLPPNSGAEAVSACAGRHATNPATGEAMPIWVADYVLGTYGSGAIMAVPAHDKRDFEFAQAFSLPVRQVVEGAPDAELPITGVPGLSPSCLHAAVVCALWWR